MLPHWERGNSLEVASKWKWEFKGECNKITPICSRKSKQYLSPGMSVMEINTRFYAIVTTGEGCLSRAEMNRLQLDQLILAESAYHDEHDESAEQGEEADEERLRKQMSESSQVRSLTARRQSNKTQTIEGIFSMIPEGEEEEHGQRNARLNGSGALARSSITSDFRALGRRSSTPSKLCV